MIKILSITLLSFCIIFISSCGKKIDPKKALATEKKQESKIKDLLIGCQINISEIDNTLQATDLVKLDKNLFAFSNSSGIFVRKRGVLLDDNQVVTSLNIRNRTEERPTKNTYIALFDGKEKKLLSSVLIGSHFDVISVIKERANNSIVKVDALVREQGQPASKTQSFKVKIEGSTISLLQ